MTPKKFVKKIEQFNREEEFLGDMSGLGKAFWLIEKMSTLDRLLIQVYLRIFHRDLVWLFGMWKNLRTIASLD